MIYNYMIYLYYIYIQNEILLSHKNKEIMLFAATWVDLEIILSKVSQKEKIKYHVISITCGI